MEMEKSCKIGFAITGSFCTHEKIKEIIQGKTMGKCRVITFRKITSQLYRRRYGKRCRKSGNRGSVTGISGRTAQ